MRNKKRGLFVVLGMIVASATFGQKNLVFDKMDHDFGEIREEGGYAEYTFNFVNQGEEPIRITNVKASCGCTTPGWTTEEVMPGDSGYVKALYNPRNRPGKFRKSLRISTTHAPSNQTLYIMGMVKPRPKTPEEEYPILIGDARLKFRNLNLGRVKTEKPVIKKFDIYNYGDSTYSLSQDQIIVPEHISLELSPEVLQPRERGSLILTYDPIKKNDFGFVSDNIILDSNDKEGLSVMVVIEEYFPEMTAEELDAAAKLEISERVFDFGKVKAGTIIETSFELANTGKEKLLFRSIKSNCGCLTYETKNKGIKKGKSQTLKVSLDTSELKGNQYKSITFYVNDPVNPTQIVTIKGSVEK